MPAECRSRAIFPLPARPTDISQEVVKPSGDHSY
jgi:hypothetical protein